MVRLSITGYSDLVGSEVLRRGGDDLRRYGEVLKTLGEVMRNLRGMVKFFGS